jgi:hypothetical protein
MAWCCRFATIWFVMAVINLAPLWTTWGSSLFDGCEAAGWPFEFWHFKTVPEFRIVPFLLDTFLAFTISMFAANWLSHPERRNLFEYLRHWGTPLASQSSSENKSCHKHGQAGKYNSLRGPMMSDGNVDFPEVTDDPVLHLILTGEARNLDEAEELYLDRSLPQIMELIGSPLSNQDLERHPLMQLLLRRGMRGWEDSLL